MLKNSLDLVEVSKSFLDEFDLFCKDIELLGKVKADHIGLKCSSKEVYELQRSYFEFNSRFIYQSIISKRRISIIGLMEGLVTSVGPLNYLELSDQKPDGSQKDIMDHLEIVPVGISYQELVDDLKNKKVVIKETVKPHHTTYDIVLPSGFIVKLSQEILIEKIKREEML